MLNEGLIDAVDIESTWHARQPEILGRALQNAVRAAPHLAQLARLILPRMPTHAIATSRLKTPAASCSMMPLDLAVQQTHLAVRDHVFVRAVVIDIDHADWQEPLEQLIGYGLPRPTWACIGPWTGRAHLAWWLTDAVLLTDRARDAPRRLLNVVAALLTQALGGDPAYAGTMTRNPWARGRPATKGQAPAAPAIWEAYQHASSGLQHAVIARPALHTLGALRGALLAWQLANGIATPRRARRIDPAESEKGRRLFDAARHRVYAAWPIDRDGVHSIVAEEAARLGSPISPRQLQGMSRRIHRWCARRYTGAGAGRANRGRDRLTATGLALAEKQSIAARRTAEAKARTRDAAILAALGRLEAADRRPTQATLAAEAGVLLRTIKRWQAATRQRREGVTSCPSVKRLSGQPLVRA